jgi:vacuolar-type H+-ATPase subunit D/Vma8
MSNKDKPDNTLLYIDLDRNFAILLERIRQLEIRINLLEKNKDGV